MTRLCMKINVEKCMANLIYDNRINMYTVFKMKFSAIKKRMNL